MTGNVQEWCLDAYRPYNPDDTTDPMATAAGKENRVVRGCSFEYGEMDCRLTDRNTNNPDSSYGDSGFRCVL